jgi:DNA-binding beta-propeller fold protein YncE
MRRLACIVALACLTGPARADLPPPWLGSFGQYGFGPGDLRHPGAVTVDRDGNVYVVDEANVRVQKFTRRGAFLLEIGPALPETLRFSIPAGLATDRTGALYVVDAGYDRVEKFTPDGAFVRQWGGYGSLPGQFFRPSAIAVDYADQVYVAEGPQHRVQRFSTDGAYRGTWSLPRYEEGWTEPRGMCAGPGNLLYVTDGNGQRVQQYLDGALVTMWGRFGAALGQMWGVAGVATDPAGNVWVAEEVNARVQVFAPDGTPLGAFGTPGSGVNQFGAATGIAFDPAGDVFVSDSGNDRVEKYGWSGVMPAHRTTWTRIKLLYK